MSDAPVIAGKKMKRLGSNPGSYKRLVTRHLGAKAAEKITKTDGDKLVAKGKRTNNKDLVRKGSFIKNVIAKEEAPATSIGNASVAFPPTARFKTVDVTDKRYRKDKMPVLLKRFRKHMEDNA